MEDRILEAVEYLTISLEEIRNYNDFLSCKPFRKMRARRHY